MESRLTPAEKAMAEIVHRAPKDDWEVLIGFVLVNREYELEDEILDFLDEHPNIELQELCDFVWSLCPEVIIEDD